MRQAWINEVRNLASEYLSDVNFVVVYDGNDKKTKDMLMDVYKEKALSYQLKYSRLDLMLPFQREGNDEREAEDVRNKLYEINDYFNNGSTLTSSDMKDKIKECRALLKILLKKEWEVTKSLREIDDKPNKKKKWYLLWIK